MSYAKLMKTETHKLFTLDIFLEAADVAVHKKSLRTQNRVEMLGALGFTRAILALAPSGRYASLRVPNGPLGRLVEPLGPHSLGTQQR